MSEENINENWMWKGASADNWRWGETTPVMAPVDEDMTITRGDMLFVHEDHVYPADMFHHVLGDTLQAGTERSTFARKFLGISLSTHLVTSDYHWIRVATTGVFALNLKEGDAGRIPGRYVGAWLGESRSVTTKDITEEESVGIVANTEPAPKGKVLVDIASAIYQSPRRSK